MERTSPISNSAAAGESSSAQDERAGRLVLPAFVAALCGVVALLLRPAIPPDEVRYLHVLSESWGHLSFLTMTGTPYAEKPPLLFWTAWLFTHAGLSPEMALRLLPALCTGATVWLVGRLARRLDLHAATGWLQGAMLLPFFFSQYLLFDPLLTVMVWAVVVSWCAAADRRAAGFSALAFLAKGPVAALFLAPFLWACQPLRPTERRSPKRVALVLLAGVAALGAWALAAGLQGDAAFRRDLWWTRWAGRVNQSFAHAAPPYFYLLLLPLAALPVTPLWIRMGRGVLAKRPRVPEERTVARLAACLVAIVVVFSLISGKQPHYMLPLMPVFALCAGAALAAEPAAATRRLRAGLAAFHVVFVVLLGGALVGAARAVDEYGPAAVTLATSSGMRAALAVGLVGHLAAAATVVSGRLRLQRSLALAMVLSTLALAPIHVFVGRAVLPHEATRVLAEADPATPIFLLGNTNDGLFHWLSGRNDIVSQTGMSGLERFVRDHPGGLVIATGGDIEKLLARGLRPLVRDRMRTKRVAVLEVPEG